MNHKKKNDIILIAVIILAAALWFCSRSGAFGRLHIGGNGLDASESIVITVDDEEVYRERADRINLPAELDIDGYNGGYNIFIINKNESEELEIYCIEADCPDKICVETGHVSMPDQPIVCLPHRVTARIERRG